LECSDWAANACGEKLQAVEEFEKRITQKVEKFKEIEVKIHANLQKINELEHLIEYFCVVQDIQDISAELTHCVHSKDEQRIVNLFLSLSGSPESNASVLGRLQEVDAPHLKLYARRMALYWHDIIKNKLSG